MTHENFSQKGRNVVGENIGLEGDEKMEESVTAGEKIWNSWND